MPNGNSQGIAPIRSQFEFLAGVGPIQGGTLPGRSVGGTPTTGPKPAASGKGGAGGSVYNGPLSGYSFLSEPFAVWLGLILVLFLFKFLSESPKTSINPAKIEIGGYNWLAIGVSAATFIMIFKVAFNRVMVPGLTEFANAL